MIRGSHEKMTDSELHVFTENTVSRTREVIFVLCPVPIGFNRGHSMDKEKHR